MRRKKIFLSFAKVSIHQWLGTLAIFLLIAPLGCGEKRGETTQHGFSIDSAYSMLTKDVDVLVSDSGETRYRLKAKEWYIYSTDTRPYWYFPKGFVSEKIDSNKNSLARIEADTAYYYIEEEVWNLIGNISVINLDGDQFFAHTLNWKKGDKQIYSNDTVTIITKDKILKGSHFTANQDFSKYTFYNSRGSMKLKEEEGTSQ
ncbi:LPS export ABC transporter periplasmic protein LptC [Porphyromonas circumdentaria]|uniref:LPS export ABC transporter protein LptC n=1 Tax=Porphyromonas circumdentaria TaxID=29524 RepID=A0A1T4PF93_9PORP|nr:LPS export ABC transporter periplasmic protein LptC [Porphyromonas circumdentaria]MBB6275694.1 LPS export ABC transporter protein LptC [Porphyromonas circumdentaria]SJZ89896.1 LPS export ABC transporter protein LptC [Porphyromonas circumdentaria]